MGVLHNRVSNRELREKMLAENTPRTTASFYKYFRIADPQAFRDALYTSFAGLNVFGRVYIAAEGINGQISVPSGSFDQFREALYAADPALNGIRMNIAIEDDGRSFWVLRMKVRSKIVADGIEDASFDPAQTGVHLGAEAFNRLAEDPDTVVVDMRNHYEYEVGHFEDALEVPSDTFRDQLPMAAKMLEEHRDKNIVMYCTGGIRCEKASAYLRHQGFEHVFQLEGGIIEYVRQAREAGLPLKFRGKNFVFDERMGERISGEILSNCHQCGAPCDTHTNCRNEACHLLFIQCEACAAKMDGCCSEPCAEAMQLPEAERRQQRTNLQQEGPKLFNKAKDHPLRNK